MKVNKLQAARDQLNTAIAMLFGGACPISTHTLAGAATNLLNDLVMATFASHSWQRHLEEDNRLSHTDLKLTLHKYQNFFKHADQDPNHTLDFDVRETEELLMLATLDYKEVAGPLSRPMQVFQAWYFATRAEKLGTRYPCVEEAIHVFPNISSASREEQIEAGLLKLSNQHGPITG